MPEKKKILIADDSRLVGFLDRRILIHTDFAPVLDSADILTAGIISFADLLKDTPEGMIRYGVGLRQTVKISELDLLIVGNGSYSLASSHPIKKSYLKLTESFEDFARQHQDLEITLLRMTKPIELPQDISNIVELNVNVPGITYVDVVMAHIRKYL